MTKEFSFHFQEIEIHKQKIRFARWEHPFQRDLDLGQNYFDFVECIVPKGSVALDIGCHAGYLAIFFALAAGKDGKLYAFEPNPYALKIFMATCYANTHLANFVLCNFAATKEDGDFIFHYSDNYFCNGGFASQTSAGIGYAGHRFPLKVKGRNLFRWFEKYAKDDIKKISFIKVDTEGYDIPVLESVIPILQISRPIIQSEIFRGYSIEDTRRHLLLLESIGYKTYFMSISEQKKIGKCNPFFLDRRIFYSKDAEELMKLTNGEDIMSVPQEKICS